jgi:hypothetical protein
MRATDDRNTASRAMAISIEDKAMTGATTQKCSSPGAIRTARSRARRRNRFRCVTIEVSDREIAAFVRGGHLPPEKRDDPIAIEEPSTGYSIL